MQTIGCVGCGNMGGALLRGFAEKLDKGRWALACFDVDASKMEALKPLGVAPAKDAASLAASADVLVLAVKPAQMPALLDEIAPRLKAGAAVVSVAAAVSLQKIRLQIGLKNVLARCMPTITAAVDCGVFALSFDPVNLTQEARDDIEGLFKNLGQCLTLEETRLNAFAAFAGAGPAYAFAFMGALAQAGLTLGFPREVSRELVIDLMRGCAALARKDGKAFAELRDDVCSPGGLTIAGINELDRAGMTGAVVDAVLEASRRGREMEESK